jgi:predicted permease
MSWISRLANVFRSARVDRELDAEVQFHIEARMDELVSGGMSREQAAAEVWRRFGNQLRLRESSREVKLFSWLESVLQDTRFGLRMLRKNLGVTAAAILSLSLAIGACTAAFSLIDALILRPLPVEDPKTLVYCSYPVVGAPNENLYIPDALYDRLQRASNRKIELFGAGIRWTYFDDATNSSEPVRIQLISGDAFRILGIRPVIGRMLSRYDDGHNVAVLNYGFWSSHFGASPSALGHWFAFEGNQYQIVGVAPKGFEGLSPGYRMDLWVSRMRPAGPEDAYSGWDQVWGRLALGITQEQAVQTLQAAFTNYRRDHTEDYLRSGRPANQLPDYLRAPLHLKAGASGSPSMVRMDFERPFWILALVALLVLLIACSNVANLLAARAAAREREMAMRISIGAGRARLIQQLLIESSLLAAMACILGLAIAPAVAPSIVNLLSPSDYPAYLDLHIGWQMLAFVACVGVAITVLFGLAPALRASGVSPHEALKAGGLKQSGRVGLLRPMLASQVGFSFVVLFIGGLLLLSFHKIMDVDLCFSKDRVALVDIGIKDSVRNDHPNVTAMELLDAVRGIPGVEAAGLSSPRLIGGNFVWIATSTIRFPGREPESSKPRFLSVSTGFMETMRIKLLDGRDFAARDMAPGSIAVLVNEEFVRLYLAGENPLGKRFERTMDDSKLAPRQIIGVVGNAKYNNLREANKPIVYEAWGYPADTLEVRAARNPIALAPTLRQLIPRVNPGLRVTNVTTQSEQINNTLLRERLLALLAAFFTVIAVLLAAIGLYGVLSYSVVRRTKEIGIRMALGARKLVVMRLVVSDVTLVIAGGLAAGIIAGLALGRFVVTLLFEVKPSDFWSLALPLACLLIASALAAIPPVFRAARVDPVVALREE